MVKKHLGMTTALSIGLLIVLTGMLPTLAQERGNGGDGLVPHVAATQRLLPVGEGSAPTGLGEAEEPGGPAQSAVDSASWPKSPNLAAVPDAPTQGANTAPALAGVTCGSFESCASGTWLEYSKQGWKLILDQQYLLVPPHGGSTAVWLGGDDDEISIIQQTVKVPSGQPKLSYWVWIASQEPQCTWNPADTGDYGIAVFFKNTTPTILDIFPLCASQNTGIWVKRTVNMSSYTGQTIDLQIRAETGPSVNSNLFVDDVALEGTQTTRLRVRLPLITRKRGSAQQPYAAPCSAGNSWCEPFNTWQTAYGPLQPGVSYKAYPNDNNDYYTLTLNRTGTVNVQLTNYQAEGQLLLRRQDLTEVTKDYNVPPNNDGNMSISAPSLPAGKYYIQVFTSGGMNQQSQYTLKMTQ